MDFTGDDPLKVQCETLSNPHMQNFMDRPINCVSEFIDPAKNLKN